MDISNTKLAVVEFEMPIKDADNPQFWLPEIIKDLAIKIEHIALWKPWPKPNDHLATFILFISEEDASYMLLRHPEMKKITYPWPPAPDSGIFTNFDKYS